MLTVTRILSYDNFRHVDNTPSLFLMPYLKELLAGSGDGAMLKFGARRIDVFTPRAGEKVNASMDMNAWTVRLGERLVKELRWQDASVRPITAAPATDANPTFQRLAILFASIAFWDSAAAEMRAALMRVTAVVDSSARRDDGESERELERKWRRTLERAS
ncbi:hypothetical protein BGX38DRAFT_1334463 [Terfezia claveryi]|nr:hypothetical protein BGX38DRAFT_1334463 [Terfezia claveryi]